VRRLVLRTLTPSATGSPKISAHAEKVWFSPEPTSRYTNFQDAVADANDGLETMLVGPNWMVMARPQRDSIPALSAIRDEIGGTLGCRRFSNSSGFGSIADA
jgi:hypothetical protein